MVRIKRLVLDVLKPHAPNSLEFCCALAETSPGDSIHCRVLEVDERTESIEVVILGRNIPFEAIQARIKSLGASLHSIDEVKVSSDPVATDTGV